MDPRLKTIAENLDSWKLGLDDSFQFHCTACGNCCIGREDILLTPRDLYNASKALNLAPTEFVETYCECYIGQDSRIPMHCLYDLLLEFACVSLVWYSL